MWYCAAKLVLKIDIFLDLLKFYLLLNMGSQDVMKSIRCRAEYGYETDL